MTPRLFLMQRLTALVLVPVVLVHLGVISYAVQNGLSAAEVLERTRGSVGWAVFYWLFVLAAGIHGGVGLRTILIEWVRLSRQAAGIIATLVGVTVMLLGTRAVLAVTVGGGP